MQKKFISLATALRTYRKWLREDHEGRLIVLRHRSGRRAWLAWNEDEEVGETGGVVVYTGAIPWPVASMTRLDWEVRHDPLSEKVEVRPEEIVRYTNAYCYAYAVALAEEAGSSEIMVLMAWNERGEGRPLHCWVRLGGAAWDVDGEWDEEHIKRFYRSGLSTQIALCPFTPEHLREVSRSLNGQDFLDKEIERARVIIRGRSDMAGLVRGK